MEAGNVISIVITLFAINQLVNAGSAFNSEVSLGNSINSFGTDVYKELIKSEENVFFSPVSLAVILNILLVGARNETARELSTILQYHSSPMKTRQFQNALHLFLKSQRNPHESFDLDMTSSIWIQNSNVLPSFKSSVEKLFFSEESEVDFQDRSTSNHINNWVDRASKGKIKTLITSDIPLMTKLILINVLYFKGKWAKSFDKSMTKDQLFYSSDPESKSYVPMMNARGKFKYSESSTFNGQILQLPYEGKEIRMTIFLPRKLEGLAHLEGQLSSEMLSETIRNVTEYRLHVNLPKFTVSSSLDLKRSLRSLGVQRVFSPGDSDLSGIDGLHDLFVSAALQKTLVEVNEEGTVAAAATKVEIVARTITPDFTADRPFMFVIEHIPTGVFLFMGRVKKL